MPYWHQSSAQDWLRRLCWKHSTIGGSRSAWYKPTMAQNTDATLSKYYEHTALPQDTPDCIGRMTMPTLSALTALSRLNVLGTSGAGALPSSNSKIPLLNI